MTYYISDVISCGVRNGIPERCLRSMFDSFPVPCKELELQPELVNEWLKVLNGCVVSLGLLGTTPVQ